MPEMTVAQFAQVKNVSRKAVFDALKHGRIRRLPNGRIDLAEALHDWEQNTNLSKGGKHPRRGGEASKSGKLDNDPTLEILADCFWEFQHRILSHAANLLIEVGLSPQQVAGFLKEKVVFDSYIMGEILGLQDEAWININCAALRLTCDEKALTNQIKAWWKESPLNES